jgi:hypothetical protein
VAELTLGQDLIRFMLRTFQTLGEMESIQNLITRWVTKTVIHANLNVSVDSWYNFGHLVRDIRLDFNDYFDVDANARVPVLKIGWGSDFDVAWNNITDDAFKFPIIITVTVFGTAYSTTLFTAFLSLLLPQAVRDSKIPSSENTPGREAESPATLISGLTEGYGVRDLIFFGFISFIATILILILAVVSPKAASTFVKKIFGGSGKTLIEEIAEEVGVDEGTELHEEMDTIIAEIALIKAETDKVQTIDDNVDDVKNDTGTLKTDTSTLKSDATNIETKVDAVKGVVDAVKVLAENIDTFALVGKKANEYIRKIGDIRRL